MANENKNINELVSEVDDPTAERQPEADPICRFTRMELPEDLKDSVPMLGINPDAVIVHSKFPVGVMLNRINPNPRNFAWLTILDGVRNQVEEDLA